MSRDRRRARRWALLGTLVGVGACAKPSPVTRARPTGRMVEVAGDPVLVVEAGLAEEAGVPGAAVLPGAAGRGTPVVAVAVRRRTPFDTNERVEVIAGRRYQWEDVKRPALGWGLGAVASAGVGGGIYSAEQTQRVETAASVTGASGAGPEVERRTVTPDSRVASTTTFVLAGAAGAVALGQLGAMALPVHQRRVSERQDFQSRRWEETAAVDHPVALQLAGEELARARTDDEGGAMLRLDRLAQVSAWAWTAQVTAGSTGSAAASVDLRESAGAGAAAGDVAARHLRSGEWGPARALVDGVRPDQAAHDPAWSGFCRAATPVAPTLDRPGDALALVPPAGPADCGELGAAIETLGRVKLVRALRDRDPRTARAWLPVCAAGSQAALMADIVAVESRLAADEEAARDRALRQQRASWAGRTNRALASCTVVRKEVDRRKRAVDRLSSRGQIGAAQTELERFQSWFQATGEPRMAAALEQLQAVHAEMRSQGVDAEIEARWGARVRDSCQSRVR